MSEFLAFFLCKQIILDKGVLSKMDNELNTQKCNSFFKNEDFEDRKNELIELFSELINFQIEINKDI